MKGAVSPEAQIAAEIRFIVQNQLDDCERAIKAGTKSIALNELEDAMRQLKKRHRSPAMKSLRNVAGVNPLHANVRNASAPCEPSSCLGRSFQTPRSSPHSLR